MIKSFIKKRPIYIWYRTRPQQYKYLKCKLLDGYYYNITDENKDSKKVVCVFDGRIKHGGLADRLRGIISTYQICKQFGIDFKICFIHPFNLENYLIPNKIDWKIKYENLNRNLCNTKVCYLNTITDSKYEIKKQEEWLEKQLNSYYNECHVLTNAEFSYKGNYSLLFNELFKLSPRLNNSISRHKQFLGSTYLSISCRFLDLLGDFNETSGTKKQLRDNEKEELISANLNQLHKLHDKYPSQQILVNSDSITFLNRAKKLDFVYVIEGSVTHIDNIGDNTYETFEKTFIDFFMIANATQIYLFKTGSMYNSGYPYAASLIYNKPFYRILF